MKKNWTLFLILAVAIATCSCQKNTWKITPQDRYYVGIGVQLAEVDALDQGFVSKDGRVYNNENGQLTGHVIVRNILENGPAYRAGIREMDILLEFEGKMVDGKEPHVWSLWGVDNGIRGGKEGEPAHFRVKRVDTDGNVIGEFNVEVKREKIDKVAWLPMDTWITSEVSSNCIKDVCDYIISVSSKFNENKDTGEFIYNYQIKNWGSSTIRIATFSPLRGFETEPGEDLFTMIKPGELKEFVLLHNMLPVESTQVEVKFRVGDKEDSLIGWLIGTSKRKISVSAFVPADTVD